MYPSSLSVDAIKLPGPISSTVQLPPETSEFLNNRHTLIVGDAHAGFGNHLNYAAHVLKCIRIPPETAEVLDIISESSFIEQMQEAYAVWKDLEKEKQKSILESNVILTNGITLVQDEAEKRYRVLFEVVSREKKLFDRALSTIVVDKRNKKGLQSLGDDVADRNNCDYYSIKVSVLLGMRKILSNHGLELLRTWVTDDWDIDHPRDTHVMSGHFVRSLNAFKILCKHGIVTKEERDNLLKEWAKTLDLMMYSKNEISRFIQISFYMHAPGRFKRIFGLADFYEIKHKPIEEMIATDVYDIVGSIMARFKQSLENFCSEDSATLAKGKHDLQAFIEYTLKNNNDPFNSNEPYNLLFMRTEEYLIKESSIDTRIINILIENERARGIELDFYWFFGHDLTKILMPAGMVGLDNIYWRPGPPQLLYPNIIIQPDNVLKTKEEFDQKTLFITDDEDNEIPPDRQMNPNVVYLWEDRSIDAIYFKLLSNDGWSHPPIYIDGELQGYDFEVSTERQYCDRYFTGIINYSVDQDKIRQDILDMAVGEATFLTEHHPENQEKIYSVLVGATSQHFPVYKNGRYTFPTIAHLSQNGRANTTMFSGPTRHTTHHTTHTTNQRAPELPPRHHQRPKNQTQTRTRLPPQVPVRSDPLGQTTRRHSRVVVPGDVEVADNHGRVTCICC